MYSYGSPHTAAQKQDDQHERTFSSCVRIQDVVLKTCLGRWTIGRSGERGSGISVLPARYDDDESRDWESHENIPTWFRHSERHFSKSHPYSRCNSDNHKRLNRILRCFQNRRINIIMDRHYNGNPIFTNRLVYLYLLVQKKTTEMTSVFLEFSFLSFSLLFYSFSNQSMNRSILEVCSYLFFHQFFLFKRWRIHNRVTFII